MFFNNWEFSLTEIDRETVFKVIPNCKRKIPLNLSKYYELNQRNIDAFVNSQFYVSYPEQLNDLLELNSELIDFSDLDFEYFMEFWKTFGEDNFEDLRNDFELQPSEHRNELRNLFYTQFVSLFGILCMTDNQHNDLMWAHYTNNQGFLIEYNTNEFETTIFKGPFPINYISQLTPCKFNKQHNIFEGFVALFMSKKKIWKYEKEYRFFCLPKVDTFFKVEGRFSNVSDYSNLKERFVKYPDESINKIILGFNFYGSYIVQIDGEKSDNICFSGNDGILKSKLFDEIIRRKLKVEVVGISKSSFNLGSKPIKIKHLGGFNYSVDEGNPVHQFS